MENEKTASEPDLPAIAYDDLSPEQKAQVDAIPQTLPIPPGPMPGVSQNPAPQPEHIMQFFAYLHLPQKLQEVARPFCELAKTLVDPVGTPLPRNPERTVALRKLLEAKDAAVRAALAE